MADVTLLRVNKVTVKPAEVGFTADFYRTHKHIRSINSIDTGWVPKADATPTGKRESFRDYVVSNADSFGMEWKPEDLRPEDNVRLAHYSTDKEVEDDAIQMIRPDILEMIGKCKYAVALVTIDVDTIAPKDKTSKGILLSGLGITDGKYTKTGNWAWADIKVTVSLTYKEEEVYIPFVMELVSGQLKKPKLIITEFNTAVQKGITDAGLMADEDLPKEDPKTEKAEDTQETVADTTDAKVEDTKDAKAKKAKKDKESK